MYFPVAGEDYEEQIDREIVIPASTAVGETVCVDIPIETDDKVEDDEMFDFELSSDNDAVVFVGVTAGSVTIEDDDSEQHILFTYKTCTIINFSGVTIEWDKEIYFEYEGMVLMACPVVTVGNLCRIVELQAKTVDSLSSPQATSMMFRQTQYGLHTSFFVRFRWR